MSEAWGQIVDMANIVPYLYMICMVYREVCIYDKLDISIYTLKREMKCLVPLWNIVIIIMFMSFFFFLAPNLCDKVKPYF